MPWGNAACNVCTAHLISAPDAGPGKNRSSPPELLPAPVRLQDVHLQDADQLLRQFEGFKQMHSALSAEQCAPETVSVPTAWCVPCPGGNALTTPVWLPSSVAIQIAGRVAAASVILMVKLIRIVVGGLDALTSARL